jgi:hypothetical protein
MFSRVFFIALVLSLVAPATDARAQSEDGQSDLATPEDAEAEAERYFREARDAFDAQRYADAQRLLEESLSLSPRASTAINLARVLRSLGKQLEIIVTIEALLAGRYGEVAAERLTEARELMAEARQNLATIVVRASGEDSVAIRVDGIRVNELGDGDAYEQELDPGEHVIIGVTDDGRLREVSVDLGSGERREVALSFSPRPEREASEGGSSGTSPWVWVAIAGGVLAVGAIVLAVFLATSGSGSTTSPPVEDPQGVFPVIEALSW